MIGVALFSPNLIDYSPLGKQHPRSLLPSP